MTEKKQKKKKKQKQKLVLKPKEKEENQKFLELLDVLEELENEDKPVDVRICPKCKSPRVRRVNSTAGDIASHMGMLPPKYECLDCGWRERLVIKATNKKLGVKEVAIIAEASSTEE